MIFNGSAGIWRKSCIQASGGWAGDTLCEDMDLSLRAAMQGWQCVFVPDIAVPQEEPEHIAHIKSQHGRWARGGAQCLRKLSLPLLRSKLSPAQKMGGLMYLSGYAAHLMMLIVIMLWLPLALHPELFSRCRWPFWVLAAWACRSNTSLHSSRCMARRLPQCCSAVPHGGWLRHGLQQRAECFGRIDQALG
jgi:cellulose synthase/poly-beta-1,6-N-acetylglucosamine synthase-like glycosyltransferase